METRTRTHGIKTLEKFDVIQKKSNGKRKPRQFSLIRLPFAHRANGSSSFVCLLTKKQTEVIHLQTD